MEKRDRVEATVGEAEDVDMVVEEEAMVGAVDMVEGAEAMGEAATTGVEEASNAIEVLRQWKRVKRSRLQ